jgi:hypothetical protein
VARQLPRRLRLAQIMWSFKVGALGLVLCVAALLNAADTGMNGSGLIPVEQGRYFWRTASAGDSAELVTLFCRINVEAGTEEVPLVAVLRDTLVQPDPETSRISYVWLLNHPRLGVGRRILSAIPFFYWRVGRGSGSVEKNNPSPLLNLTAPLHPVLSGVGHGLLQWTVLDPAAMAVRASSRAYRTNQSNDERLHLEEAISYVRNAPASQDFARGLTQTELDTVIARLELRKRLLGGLMGTKNIAEIGKEAGWEEGRIHSRNWELVRQCADKTGLIFEAVNVSGSQYAMLWFPVEGPRPRSGVPVKFAWRVLRISDPWSDSRMKEWKGPTYSRAVDANGNLLPAGATGEREVKLIPLALYSLSYPRVPLLMVDFRDGYRLRTHEMMQRAVNDVTSGVIGLSHFTNWYYYAGAAFYNFYTGRQGAATNQAERLDAYSQFRADLAFDKQLDSGLRKELQTRVQSLSINPREASLNRSVQIANERYARLLDSVTEGSLLERLDKDRRTELASFGESKKSAAVHTALHFTTLGLYTHRAPESPDNLVTLERERQVIRQLAFIDSLVVAGTQPEISYQVSLIRDSVTQLGRLMPSVRSAPLRSRATRSLEELQKLSRDSSVQAECTLAAEAIRRDDEQQKIVRREQKLPIHVRGVAATTRTESMK